MKLLNGAVGEIRFHEQKGQRELKKPRDLWQKNPEKLTARERAGLANNRPYRSELTTALAYRTGLYFGEYGEQAQGPWPDVP